MAKAHDETPAEEEVEEVVTDLPAEPDFQEKYLRAQADLDNQRKRFEIERANLLKYGQEGLLSDLLPVVDNFDRATEHVPAEQQGSAWVTGIQYIQKNLMDALAQHGVSAVETAVGEAYDPETQEAIGMVESNEVEDGHIVQVAGKGYRLHDRLLRPARVLVATHHQTNEK